MTAKKTRAATGAKSAPASKARGPKASAAAAAAAAAKVGNRGTAPWVARHAAKHAEEALRRNAGPIHPDSARATLRAPAQADALKASVRELHTALGEIRTLKKHLADRFWEIGLVLGHIKERELFAAKGYHSFETFVERELDLGRGVCLTLERIPRVFVESAARQLGLVRLTRAIAALDESAEPAAAGLPMRPPTAPKR
ncbi:MAG: hypothetical protein KF718_22120 [Polyangiaceae bacterium]|nr:hypothetical protein [Polyangiaceae bacterium]